MNLDLTDAVAPALLLGFLAFQRVRLGQEWVRFKDERLPTLDDVTAIHEMEALIRRGFYADGVRDMTKAWLFSSVVMAVLHMLGVV